MNCGPGALQYAAKVLRERIETFGSDSDVVRRWVSAQEQVFAACGAGEADLPDPPPADAPAVEWADREYQTAAACFYGGRHEEAAARFVWISKNPDSPHRQWSLYLAARAHVRKAALAAKSLLDSREELEIALRLVRESLEETTDPEVRHAAEDLLANLRLKLEPEGQRLTLAAQLMQPGLEDRLKPRLWDYVRLFNTLPKEAERDELSEWILTMRDRGPGAAERALAGLQRNRTEKSPSQTAWLLAALTKVSGDHAQAGELLDQAAELPPESSSSLWASYERARIIADQGAAEQARRTLEEVIGKQADGMPRSARNRLLQLRAKLALNFDEFLQFSVLVPTAHGYSREDPQAVEDWWYHGLDEVLPGAAADPGFEADTLVILNERLPLAYLRRAAQASYLPRPIRAAAARAAWTRAVLYRDYRAAGEATPLLLELQPDLAPLLDVFRDATTDSDRAFAAAYAISKRHDLQPFIPRFPVSDWCLIASAPPMHFERQYRRGAPPRDDLWDAPPPFRSEFPKWLPEEDRQAMRLEAEKLFSIPAQRTWACKEVIEYVNSGARLDDRVAEALHLCVGASPGYGGCADENTNPLLKRAFQLLHRKLPNSGWARKTKYWYEAHYWPQPPPEETTAPNLRRAFGLQ